MTESEKLFTEFNYNFISYKAAGFTCREHPKQRISQVGSSEFLRWEAAIDSVREIYEESTWNQLLKSSSDGPGSPNNVIRNEVTRYVKDKLEPQKRDPSQFQKKILSTTNRPVLGFGCRNGFCRISIYYSFSRILPDRNQLLGRGNITIRKI